MHSLLVFAAAATMTTIAITRDAWPWIADDAFISLRYSENLLLGHGLVWNPGERVEGYSNLLWVLLTAGLGAVGMDLVVAARALTVACTAATLALLCGSRLLPSSLPAQLVVLLLAAQGSLAVWAIGGLEAPLAMLLVAATMFGLGRWSAGDPRPGRRWLAFAGGCLALLAWTRPDGPLWAAVAAAAVWWRTRRARPWPALLTLLAPPAVAMFAQLVFRLAYYDDWLPNTAHAKVAPIADCVAAGYAYLASAAVALRSLLLPAAVGAVLGWRVPRARPLLLFATLGVVAWGLYVVRVGGDVFPRNRFLLVAFAPLVVLAGHGIGALAAWGRVGTIAAWLAVLSCIGLARFDAERPTTDPHQQLSAWEWRAAAIGDWLGRGFAPQQPLVAVDAAGAVPFFSKLPSLDMLGLCDRTIARTPPSSDRGFIVGHNRGNGPYVLSRRPDLVVFYVPGIDPIPHWKSGQEMIADPAFFAGHRLVLFETGPTPLGDGGRDNVQFVPWVRLEGRIGVHHDGPRVVVPGYLLASFRQAFPLQGPPMEGLNWLQDGAVVGVLDPVAGRIVGEVRRTGRHTLRELPLPAGEWRVHADGAPAAVTFALAAAGPGRFDLIAEVPADVPVPFRLTEIVLQRRE